MITIVDYGVGNVRAIANMLKKLGMASNITGGPEEIEKATKLILPGVGAYDTAMQALNRSGIRNTLERKVLQEKVPLLGICLGMQLLMEGSEEGEENGLGWIPGRVFRFPHSQDLKVPHMKWSALTEVADSPLFKGFEEEARFYFVHSFYVKTSERKYCLSQAQYGFPFDAAIGNENIMGVQFHPERSHRYGLQLLNNFIQL